MYHSIISFLSALIKNRSYSSSRLGRIASAGMVLIIVVATFVSAKDLARPKQSSSAAKASKASAVATSKQMVAFPVASSMQVAASQRASSQSKQIGTPDSLQTVLYDQTDSASGTGTVSQNFEAANDAFDAQTADDFVVPAGGWTIGQVNVGGVYFNGPGPANSVNVFFYADAATFPGAAVAGGTYMNVAITSGAATGSFNIVLPTPLTLAPGTYWVSVQANMDFPVWRRVGVERSDSSIELRRGL